jgi:hypothetical protein
MPHLLWHGTSVFPVSSEGPPHLVAFYDTRGDVEGMWRIYSNPDPHGLSMSLKIKFRCNCYVAVYKNRFCTCILIVKIYSQMKFFSCFRIYFFSQNASRCHCIWQTPWMKNSKMNCSDISRTAFRNTEAVLKFSLSSKRHNLTVYIHIVSENRP